MLTILAIDRNDGWVFVRDGETIRLLRPPYRLSEGRVASEAILARAVEHHGYFACDERRATWHEVVASVRGIVAEQRASEGRPMPDEGVGRAMLRVATASMVERILDRVAEELLAKDDLEAAQNVLCALQVESPHLKESSALNRRTAELLERVGKRREERAQRILDSNGRFPFLAKTGKLLNAEQHAHLVARRGSMFVRDQAPRAEEAA